MNAMNIDDVKKAILDATTELPKRLGLLKSVSQSNMSESFKIEWFSSIISESKESAIVHCSVSCMLSCCSQGAILDLTSKLHGQLPLDTKKWLLFQLLQKRGMAQLRAIVYGIDSKDDELVGISVVALSNCYAQIVSDAISEVFEGAAEPLKSYAARSLAPFGSRKAIEYLVGKIKSSHFVLDDSGCDELSAVLVLLELRDERAKDRALQIIEHLRECDSPLLRHMFHRQIGKTSEADDSLEMLREWIELMFRGNESPEQR